MAEKIHLYHPLNRLKPFGDNIWIADGGTIHMAFPLGIKVPFRLEKISIGSFAHQKMRISFNAEHIKK